MKKTICSIAALLMFGMAGVANANSYTLTANTETDSISSSGTPFTVTGSSTATAGSTFESATLTVVIDAYFNSVPSGSDFSAWFDNATSKEVQGNGNPVYLESDGGWLNDYTLTFTTFTNPADFGSDTWYGNSLLMNISLGGYGDYYAALDSESLTINYTTDPSTVPEPGTLLLLGAGMFGIAMFQKRRSKLSR